MREGAISSVGKKVASHLVTAVLTLMLVFVFFGDFSGGRRPVLAQIRGRARTEPPPVPVPAVPSAPAVPAADLGSQAPAPPEDVLKDLDPDERNNVRVYNSANKSVVNITTETEVSGFFGDETSTGTGSGFVIDKDGHVLTNFHVIHGDDASRVSVRVTLFDGSAHEATIIGADATNDVAVLRVKVPADKLFPLKLGDSSTVMVGQKILALGNPFGLERHADLGDRQ